MSHHATRHPTGDPLSPRERYGLQLVETPRPQAGAGAPDPGARAGEPGASGAFSLVRFLRAATFLIGVAGFLSVSFLLVSWWVRSIARWLAALTT